MAMNTTEMLIGVVLLLGVLYYYLTRNYNFWKSRNVDGPKPNLILGNMEDVVFSKCSLPVHLRNVYKEYPNASMIGIYSWSEPVLILNDLDLIKNVLVKDFESFMDRDGKPNDKLEPLSAHLMFLEAERWQPLRNKIMPAFTSSKIRGMFHLLIDCANLMDAYLNQVDGRSINVRDISAKFALDVIGACAFGVRSNTLAEVKCEFREVGKRIFNMRWKNYLKYRVQANAPGLFNVIGGFLVDHKVTKYFLDLTRNTIENRKKNNFNRNDFIDLLTAIKDEPNVDGGIELTDSLMAAQLFVFFIASFATSSATISNCLFELAMNPEIREKVRKEIRSKLTATNGRITYDSIENMKYLDKVINETLRKYPPGPVIKRQATKPYTFPGTEISIPVGTKIWIPTFAIQRDPKYYPNPDKFDPERFNEFQCGSRPQLSFLAFGAGPRNCIGENFGRMQTKIGVVKILQNHTVEVCDKTDKDYEMNPKAAVLAPKHGIFLKIKKTTR
nr:cytochrome P450 4AV17 [Meteorus pulchricornis]